MERYKEVKILEALEEEYTKKIYKLKNELSATEDILIRTQLKIDELQKPLDKRTEIWNALIEKDKMNDGKGVSFEALLHTVQVYAIDRRFLLSTIEKLKEDGQVAEIHAGVLKPIY
jgi:hypothetical protein